MMHAYLYCRVASKIAIWVQNFLKMKKTYFQKFSIAETPLGASQSQKPLAILAPSGIQKCFRKTWHFKPGTGTHHKIWGIFPVGFDTKIGLKNTSLCEPFADPPTQKHSLRAVSRAVSRRNLNCGTRFSVLCLCVAKRLCGLWLKTVRVGAQNGTSEENRKQLGMTTTTKLRNKPLEQKKNRLIESISLFFICSRGLFRKFFVVVIPSCFPFSSRRVVFIQPGLWYVPQLVNLGFCYLRALRKPCSAIVQSCEKQHVLVIIMKRRASSTQVRFNVALQAQPPRPPPMNRSKRSLSPGFHWWGARGNDATFCPVLHQHWLSKFAAECERGRKCDRKHDAICSTIWAKNITFSSKKIY